MINKVQKVSIIELEKKKERQKAAKYTYNTIHYLTVFGLKSSNLSKKSKNFHDLESNLQDYLFFALKSQFIKFLSIIFAQIILEINEKNIFLIEKRANI